MVSRFLVLVRCLEQLLTRYSSALTLPMPSNLVVVVLRWEKVSISLRFITAVAQSRFCTGINCLDIPHALSVACSSGQCAVLPAPRDTPPTLTNQAAFSPEPLPLSSLKDNVTDEDTVLLNRGLLIRFSLLSHLFYNPLCLHRYIHLHWQFSIPSTSSE